MQLTDGTIILRDFIEKDIESRIRWETEDTEWQLWDGPWEYEGVTAEQKKKELGEYVERLHRKAEEAASMADDEMRRGFEICASDGHYIGWCNSYFIDDACAYSITGSRRAVGIDIPETVERGRHYGFRALCLLIDYLMANGCNEVYTQTWSGNVRMIGLAEKLGFEEFLRKPDFRTVRGGNYDGLTFKLNSGKYSAAKKRFSS